MAITLTQLCRNAEKNYNMKLIAGRDGMDNTVRWVHMVDDSEVPDFLHGNELVFTTGIGHSGSDWLEPFVKRLKEHNAFYAASEALCCLHEEIDKLGYKDLVYTTGEVVCHPCVHTCVPDFFDFSFDSRHEDPKVFEKVLAIVKSCAVRTWAGCTCEAVKAWKRDTVYWDKKLVGYVKQSCEELGIKHRYIHSGAGHDAQFAAYMLPTTMIFVQSKDGLSHCEPEFSSVEHCTEGASVMLNAVLKADAE